MFKRNLLDALSDRMIAAAHTAVWPPMLFADGDEGQEGAGGGAEGGDGGSAGAAEGKGAEGAQAGAEGQEGGKGEQPRGEGGKFAPKEEPDWRETLKEDEDLYKFAQRLNSPVDAVREAFKNRQRLSTALIKPDDESDDDVKARWFEAIGRPESPDKYDLAPPDNLPEHLQLDDTGKERLGEFGKIMFEAGAPSGVVKAAVDWYFNDLARLDDEADKRLAEHNEKGDQLLEREWGSEFDKNIEMAKAAWKTLPDGLRERLETLGVDVDPEMKRYMASLARRMRIMEDDMSDVGLGEDRRESLERRMKELEENPNRWDDPKIDEEIQSIRKTLWPQPFNRQVA